MYILIPLLAIFVLVNQPETGTAGAGGDDHGSEAPAEPGGEGEGEGQAGGGTTVVSDNFAFDTDTLTATAGEDLVVTLQNPDAAPHNIAVYASAADGPSETDPIFQGEVIDGGAEVTYTIPAPEEPGDYYFQCDIHPNMNGTFTVQ
jgi:plastocyanin